MNYSQMTPRQRARYNRAPRSKLAEVREILLNMAQTFRDAQRVNFYEDVSVVLADYQVDGMVEGFKDMADTIRDVMEGM